MQFNIIRVIKYYARVCVIKTQPMRDDTRDNKCFDSTRGTANDILSWLSFCQTKWLEISRNDTLHVL